MLFRTAQTIKKSTQVVKSFRLPTTKRSIDVRKLSGRTNRPHYIVVFSDSSALADYEEVKVVTEVSFSQNKLRYVATPSAQYPDLLSIEDDLKKIINEAISNELKIQSLKLIN